MSSIKPLVAALVFGVAAAAVPTAASAQDTTRTRTATGEVESSRVDNRGLSRSTVERLQTRLSERGCDPGPVDGLIGRRTRAAIECARQRENVPGTDIRELLRALDVTPADRPGAQRRDTTAAARDTSGMPQMRMDTSRTMQRDSMRMRDTSVQRMRDTSRMQMRDTLRERMRDPLRDTMPQRPQRDTLRDTIPPRPPSHR